MSRLETNNRFSALTKPCPFSLASGANGFQADLGRWQSLYQSSKCQYQVINFTVLQGAEGLDLDLLHGKIDACMLANIHIRIITLYAPPVPRAIRALGAGFIILDNYNEYDHRFKNTANTNKNAS